MMRLTSPVSKVRGLGCIVVVLRGQELSLIYLCSSDAKCSTCTRLLSIFVLDQGWQTGLTWPNLA